MIPEQGNPRDYAPRVGLIMAVGVWLAAIGASAWWLVGDGVDFVIGLVS